MQIILLDKSRWMILKNQKQIIWIKNQHTQKGTIVNGQNQILIPWYKISAIVQYGGKPWYNNQSNLQ